MNKLYPITFLRVVCLVQIFFLHYFAGIELREYIWVFSVAVPVFLLVSAYLYGLKHTEKVVYGKEFLSKRFKSLSIVYYPFLIAVFAYYATVDFGNVYGYLLSFGGSLLYLTNFVKPLPNCGHLWFMQTLMLCYIALAVCSRFEWVERCFKNPFIASGLLLAVVACGFVYRGDTLVYLYFYLFTFYNAKRISERFSTGSIAISVVGLLIGYFLLSIYYEDAFKMGIYFRFIQTCAMAIVVIQLFMVLFRRMPGIPLINWMAAIGMEFYLVHHLFVFDFPIYVSFPVTIGLSVILHWVASTAQRLILKTSV